MLSLLLVSALLGTVSSNPLDLLWPIPNDYTVGSDMYSVDPKQFMFVADGPGASSDILKEALDRYKRLIFLPPPIDPVETSVSSFLDKLTVTVQSSDESLKLETNNSYMLDTSMAKLESKTVYGALRGLETFSQLFTKNTQGQFIVPSFKCNDTPTFPFRGFLLDTSRHFLPIERILEHLDAMAYNKFNVFHWHVTDDPSFPYISKAFPNLSAKGAYNQNHTYSQEDVANVIKYAWYRGIRVLAEFDTPGHTLSWGPGQPGLLTPCYSNGKPNGQFGPINPTLDSTYTFLKEFFTEIAGVFPDDYIHLGGDEVKFDCWQSNPDIQKFVMDHNYTSYSQLEQYYEVKLLELIEAIGKQYLVWQEIFDNGLKIQPDTVIHVWKAGWQKEMYNVTKAGYKTILSSCWYLNRISSGVDWPQFYGCNPLDFNGTTEQQSLVVGGEACMWGENVDSSNLLSRSWPRASTVAERLWSRTKFSFDAAKGRLQNQQCRMISRGIPAEPPNGPSYCPVEWMK